MSAGESAGPEHSRPTRKRKLRYLFATKHHGARHGDAAVWSPTLTPDEEFAVFDDADTHDLDDDRGYYYGVRNTPDGLMELGTWGKQVAEFPLARENEAWHGYPLWPLKNAGPDNRRGERHRPEPVVFGKMELAGLISRRDRRRLMKGDHA